MLFCETRLTFSFFIWKMRKRIIDEFFKSGSRKRRNPTISIIAHRGSSGKIPAHTIPAVRLFLSFFFERRFNAHDENVRRSRKGRCGSIEFDTYPTRMESSY